MNESKVEMKWWFQQLSNLFSFFALDTSFCPGHSWNRRKEETEISEIQNENLLVEPEGISVTLCSAQILKMILFFGLHSFSYLFSLF